MNKLITTLGIITVLMIGTGCGRSSVNNKPSVVFENFSTANLIMELDDYELIQSSTSSSAIIDTDIPFHQKNEETLFQIEPQYVSGFIKDFQSEVLMLIEGNNGRIIGSGQGGHEEAPHFSYRYQIDDTVGVINTWMVHGDGLNLVLVLSIIEFK